MSTQLTAANLRTIQAELTAAMAAVATKHGLSITFAGGKFDVSGTFANLKLSLEHANESGAVVASAERTLYTWGATLRGLPIGGQAREVFVGGKIYVVCGLLPRGKFTVLVKQVSNGKMYKLAERDVAAAFARVASAGSAK